MDWRDGADETISMGKYEKTAEKFSVADIMYMPYYVSSFKSGSYQEMVSEIRAKEETEKRAAVRKAKEERKRVRREKICYACSRKLQRKNT